MPSKRCGLSIQHVPAIAALSFCKESPRIASSRHYLSYSFIQQEAERMATGLKSSAAKSQMKPVHS